MPGTEPKSELPPVGPVYIDRDLYCLKCGYNLRGLSGDPARCPECGYDNPIADVEVPAELISRQLKKMEPGAAVLMALLSGFFVPVTAIAVLAPLRKRLPACMMLPGVIVPAIWLYLSLVKFPKGCLRKPGWFAALMAYHFWAIVATAGAIGLPILAVVYAVPFFEWLHVHRIELRLVSAGVAIALYVLAFKVCIPRIYRRATRTMIPLQREVAVTIAQTEKRKLLARDRNWPLSG